MNAESAEQSRPANWLAARCASWKSGKITSLVVTDAERRPLGVLHLHDLWTLELLFRVCNPDSCHPEGWRYNTFQI